MQFMNYKQNRTKGVPFHSSTIKAVILDQEVQVVTLLLIHQIMSLKELHLSQVILKSKHL